MVKTLLAFGHLDPRMLHGQCRYWPGLTVLGVVGDETNVPFRCDVW